MQVMYKILTSLTHGQLLRFCRSEPRADDALGKAEDMRSVFEQNWSEISLLLTKFEAFVEENGRRDPDWKFWEEFV